MSINKTYLMVLAGLAAAALAVMIPALAWLSPLTFMLLLPSAAIWLWKSEGRSWWDLGFRFVPGWFRILGVGLIFGLAIPVFFQAIQVLGGWISLTPRVNPLKGLASYLLVLILKMICIVAIEEFVFRGFFLQALGRKTGVRLAIGLSSFLWGISHLPLMVNAGLPLGLILVGLTTFLLWGITLALGYICAGKSLWLPYGLHLGINLSFSLVGWPFITQPHAPQWWLGNPSWSPESGLIGVLVWLALAVIMVWITGKPRINDFSS